MVLLLELCCWHHEPGAVICAVDAFCIRAMNVLLAVQNFTRAGACIQLAGFVLWRAWPQDHNNPTLRVIMPRFPSSSMHVRPCTRKRIDLLFQRGIPIPSRDGLTVLCLAYNAAKEVAASGQADPPGAGGECAKRLLRKRSSQIR
eukprot:3842595-Amphidinium_carterae.1